MRGPRGPHIFLVATYFIIFGTADQKVNFKIKENGLEFSLSEAEWKSLFGNSKADSEFALTFPDSISPEENLSSGESSQNLENDNNLVHRVNIFAPNLQKNFSLDLIQNSGNILAEDALFLETFRNETSPLKLEPEDLNCYFRGEFSALSLCDGQVRGLVHSNSKDFYIIHPLPKRFQNGTSVPHILLKKSHGNKTTIKTNDRHTTEKYQNNNSNKSWPETKDQSTTESIEKEIKSRRRTKDQLTVETVEKKKERNRRRKRETSNRKKRETVPLGSPVFVETAVFVDKDLFHHMKMNFPRDTERELVRFVLAMINAVQLLYHDSSLGRPVNFVLKRLEILKEENAGLARPPDIDRFLSNFCNWQRTKNPVGDREPQHWDHALILTGLDLYVRGKHGKISSQVVGLAPVAGMCTATSSCTVNEGRHFESVYVVAHEIGHNLGMRHDGPLADNDCDPSSYIMSPTLGSGKITWSSCSRQYLQSFLETTQSRCLLDHSSSAGQLDHSAEGALPGERFDANQQCMLKYGRGSRHSSQQPLDDVCRDLHCERERYTWTSHPALEGTKCGQNTWCRGGRCVPKTKTLSAAYYSSRPSSQKHTEEKTDGSWSKWRPFTECASGCLFGPEGRLRSGSTGIMFSTRSCNTPQPRGGGRKCSGPEKKYKACNAQQCLNVPRLTIGEFAQQICARAKDIDSDLTGIGIQKASSDPEEACVVWCLKRNGGSKSRGWTFPDGTACRKNHHSLSSSYCVNGKCEEFTCEEKVEDEEETTYAQMSDLCPVERNDNHVGVGFHGNREEMTPSLKKRWKSASGCHFNCVLPGSGIRLVVEKGKIGKNSIRLCQPDHFGCTRVKTPFQHASFVCSKYKERVRRLSGLGMQISPVLEDPDRPCKVACQDENISHRFYLVNGEEGWFPFGTDCSRGIPEKKSYCVSGKCLEFGADDTPLSESEFTLPLLSRSRRSLENAVKVKTKLNQTQLDEIVDALNRTITGHESMSNKVKFDIDLSHPVHINMDTQFTNNYYKSHNNQDQEDNFA